MRLVERGWGTISGVKELSLADLADYNEFLDSILEAEDAARSNQR